MCLKVYVPYVPMWSTMCPLSLCGVVNVYPATDDNKTKLCHVLAVLGYVKEDVENVRSLDFSNPAVFSLGVEPQKIDFITQVVMVDFAEAYEHKVTHILDDGLAIHVVGTMI